MNLILVEPGDFIAEDRVRLTGRRAAHVREVHRAVPGDVRRVGLLGGNLGAATVVHVDDATVELAVALVDPPPAPLPITLVLALPRPKVLRRVLQSVAAIGIKRAFLVHAWRVEKSYWSSPLLAPSTIESELRLGLEQGVDTILPEVSLRKRLRPFVEDELPAIVGGRRALVGDGDATLACPHAVSDETVLAIGPDGGFNPFEIGMLAAIGFRPVSLGPRSLRVENALPAFVSRISP